jgi:hypothetical protein
MAKLTEEQQKEREEFFAEPIKGSRQYDRPRYAQ